VFFIYSFSSKKYLLHLQPAREAQLQIAVTQVVERIKKTSPMKGRREILKKYAASWST
jgi:hypothetical protein